MTKNSILIVEDEPKIANLLQDYLKQSGLDSEIINNGDLVSDWIRINKVDLILLDIMLPGKDGLTICKEIRRESDIPIIFISARVEEIDRILGLELGADDYICKPFSPREVVVRVKTVLRRIALIGNVDISSAILLDENKYQVIMRDKSVALTAVEFQLFKLMFNQPGRIFSRQQLMDNIYSDYRIVSSRTIDSHIKKLRKKLQVLNDDDIIHSVYAVGYKYEPI